MAKIMRFEVVPLQEVPLDDAGPLGAKLQPAILIVDDERIIADTLSIILGKNGYRVMTAYDGETAFKLACESAPDLLLTDVAMPGMTGIELAIEVVETIPSCKVLLFSGHATTMDLLLEARDKGYEFQLLTKPLHPSDMLRHVSESLTISELEVDLPSNYSLLSLL